MLNVNGNQAIMTVMAPRDKMADYFPLISKVVAGLAANSSSESRQDLYDRARAALLDELRIADPPFSEFQIMRERLALEDAVSRVEWEAAQRDGETPVSTFGNLSADAADLATTVAIPLMIVSGNANGKMDPLWRFAWR
jgi:hypothetical protein